MISSLLKGDRYGLHNEFTYWWSGMKPFERYMYLNEWQLILTAPAGENERRPSSNSDF